MREKLDELIGEAVQVNYNDMSQTISFFIRIRGYDKYFIWGEDMNVDSLCEEIILLKKRVVGYNLIKKKCIDEMNQAYRVQQPVKPDLNIM